MSRVLAGIPPRGLGVYARNQMPEVLSRFDFVCVNAWRADATRVGAALIARGVEVWFYGTPENWAPSTWGAGITRCLAAVEATPGSQGFIADPENGWPGQPPEVAEAMGRALAHAAGTCRVGLTSFPGIGRGLLQAWARGASGQVWGSPQMYGQRGVHTPAGVAQYWAQWTDAFGAARCVPSVAGYMTSRGQAQGWPGPDYAVYLSTVPVVGGSIAWLGAGQLPAALIAQLEAWAGGHELARAASVVRSLAGSPVVVAVVVAVVLAVVATIAGIVWVA